MAEGVNDQLRNTKHTRVESVKHFQGGRGPIIFMHLSHRICHVEFDTSNYKCHFSERPRTISREGSALYLLVHLLTLMSG